MKLAIEISTWAELDDVRNDLSADYVLVNDLDSDTDGYDTYASETANGGDGWDPIGDWGAGEDFTGVFDGGDYEIQDMYVDRPSMQGVALFASTNSTAEIKNTHVIDFDIIGLEFVAGIVGRMLGESVISSSSASGNATDDEHYAAILVGIMNDYSQAKHCYANGTAQSDGWSGIITAAVFNKFETQSGEARIYQCYAEGEVNSSGGGEQGEWGGGLIGYSDVKIKNCYSTVDVNSDNGGGFVGELRDSRIDKCYSTGTVTGSNTNGFIGYDLDRGGDAGDCFYDTETSGQSTDPHATGKTTAEMQDVATYTDTATTGLDNPWDFVNNPNDDTADNDYWDIDDGYPYLTAFETGEPITVNGDYTKINFIPLNVNAYTTNSGGDYGEINFKPLYEYITYVRTGTVGKGTYTEFRMEPLLGELNLDYFTAGGITKFVFNPYTAETEIYLATAENKIVEAIRNRLLRDSIVTNRLTDYEDEAAVFTQVPPPPDFDIKQDWPYVICEGVATDDTESTGSGKNMVGRDVNVDIRVYQHEKGSASELRDLAEYIWKLFHRKKLPVTNYDTMRTTANGPLPAPTETDYMRGRIITLTITLSRSE